MKREAEKPVQSRHVCYEIGCDLFAIELRVHLENGERCEPCMIAIYDAIGRLARGALVKKQHRATKGEVEELQHEVYDLLTEKGYRRLQEYNPARGAFEAWLAAFIDHHLIDRHRKRHREASLDEISAAVCFPDPGQEAEYLKAERIDILRRAIAELPVRHQKFLKLWMDDGLSTRDIAKAIGCKPEDVRRLKYKLITRLRRAILDASRYFSKKITNGRATFCLLKRI